VQRDTLRRNQVRRLRRAIVLDPGQVRARHPRPVRRHLCPATPSGQKARDEATRRREVREHRSRAREHTHRTEETAEEKTEHKGQTVLPRHHGVWCEMSPNNTAQGGRLRVPDLPPGLRRLRALYAPAAPFAFSMAKRFSMRFCVASGGALDGPVPVLFGPGAVRRNSGWTGPLTHVGAPALSGGASLSSPPPPTPRVARRRPYSIALPIHLPHVSHSRGEGVLRLRQGPRREPDHRLARGAHDDGHLPHWRRLSLVAP
jgi:hypothetical protein